MLVLQWNLPSSLLEMVSVAVPVPAVVDLAFYNLIIYIDCCRRRRKESLLLVVPKAVGRLVIL